MPDTEPQVAENSQLGGFLTVYSQWSVSCVVYTGDINVTGYSGLSMPMLLSSCDLSSQKQGFDVSPTRQAMRDLVRFE